MPAGTGAAAGAAGAAGGAGTVGLGAGAVRSDRATVRVEDRAVWPDVPVGASVMGRSMRSWTRSLICAVTTCMRCVSSPVSSSVSCCAATCSARRLLAYE